MKKGQENDWKVSFTTWVVPTQEKEMHSTIRRPPSTFKAVPAQVCKDWLSLLVSLPGVSARDSEPSSPAEAEGDDKSTKTIFAFIEFFCRQLLLFALFYLSHLLLSHFELCMSWPIWKFIWLCQNIIPPHYAACPLVVCRETRCPQSKCKTNCPTLHKKVTPTLLLSDRLVNRWRRHFHLTSERQIWPWAHIDWRSELFPALS